MAIPTKDSLLIAWGSNFDTKATARNPHATQTRLSIDPAPRSTMGPETSPRDLPLSTTWPVALSGEPSALARLCTDVPVPLVQHRFLGVECGFGV